MWGAWEGSRALPCYPGGLKVSWMDVCLGMQLGDILCSVPLLLSPGLCHPWIKTEVTQGAGNLSTATRAECPSCRAGLWLPVSHPNPQFTCRCLPASLTSAGRTGQAYVQHIYSLVDRGMRSGWGASQSISPKSKLCSPCMCELRILSRDG